MSRFIIQADWDNNAPHLTAQAKADLWASIPAYQQDARTKGIPQLGAGVIYPVPDNDILCDPFPIPPHWLCGYTLDVGWGTTAVEWRAFDPDTRHSYFYDEHYQTESSPDIHAAAIRRRGLWIPGKLDPAARGRKQDDGKRLIELYRTAIYGADDVSLGNRMLTTAVNAVEAGIYTVLMGYQQGTTKIMRGRCPNLLAERRLYRRNERGEIIKKFDHAMDAQRYNLASGDTWLAQKPATVVEDPVTRFASGGSDGAGLEWMAHI